MLFQRSQWLQSLVSQSAVLRQLVLCVMEQLSVLACSAHVSTQRRNDDVPALSIVPDDVAQVCSAASTCAVYDGAVQEDIPLTLTYCWFARSGAAVGCSCHILYST